MADNTPRDGDAEQLNKIAIDKLAREIVGKVGFLCRQGERDAFDAAISIVKDALADKERETIERCENAVDFVLDDAALSPFERGAAMKCRKVISDLAARAPETKPPVNRDRPELTALIERARAAYEAMTPEEKAQHDKAQAESWVRGNIELDRMERTEGRTGRMMPAAGGHSPIEPTTREGGE